MTPASLDWGLILAVALGLFASFPFLARAGLPHHTDAELHVYRTAELSRIVHEGVVYPRWAANLYLGYGYPIFNYYAPLTYHLGGLAARVVPSVGIVGGTKSVFISGLVLAAIGAYLLGRELFGPTGGVLAATSFTLSPYVVFIDPHARGDLAEHFAVCLMPLALYFLHRLLERSSRGAFLGSVLTISAMVFSHNLLGLASSALLLAYWTWQVVIGQRRQNAVWGMTAFAVAAGLIAFFWLPALLEYNAVKLEVVGPGHFDYREHFCSLVELLAPSRRIDWGAVGPRFRHNVGLVQWLLALAAVAVLARRAYRDREVFRETGFFVVGAAVLLFLMHSVSSWVWEAVPLMPYLQFPWRLLGPANLMLALCAASAARWLPERVSGRLLSVGAFGLLIVGALPLLYPPPWPEDFGGTEAADILHWERTSQALGTTSTGDFLPTTVEVIPSVARTLVESYETGGPVDKINRATLPDDAEVEVISHGPTHDEVHVVTSRALILRFYTFHFPGWRAYLDGEEVDIEIGRPEGFITVPVPPGDHTVSVRFEDTWARRLGWAVAASSVLALIAVVLLQPGGLRRQESLVRRRLNRPHAILLAGTLLMVLLVKLAVLDPQGWLYVQSPPGQSLVAQHSLSANFGNEIQLVGYDLPRTTVRPGDTVDLVLYWHALTQIDENYQSFVHIAEPLQTVWAQEDHLNPGGLPTSRWPRDRYVWDAYAIDVPPDVPAGEYKINVGIYLRAEGYRLAQVDGEEQAVGDSLVIGSLVVKK